MIIREDCVVDIYNNKKIVSAYCFEVKNSTARCLTEGGKELKIPTDKILHLSNADKIDSSLKNSIVSYLKEVSARRNAIAASFPLCELWELCDEEDSFAIDELAENWYGSSLTDDEFAGFQRAILSSNPYFRRKNELFLPNSKSYVSEFLRMREAEASKQEKLDNFSQAVKAVMSGSKVNLTENFKEFIDMFIDVAVKGKESSHFKSVAAVCSSVNLLVENIFSFLVKSEIMSEDENLSLRQYDLSAEFPLKVEEECVDNVRKSNLDSESSDYEDLTDIEAFTIDGETTEDIDDALSIEFLDGKIRAAVHITDVSRFIPVSSLTDEEAFNRTTSLYFPEKRINMLPAVLAEDQASLKKNEERRALSFFFVFNERYGDYNICDFYIRKTKIKSSARLTYGEADTLIAEGGSIASFYAIAQNLFKKRVQRGAITLSTKRVCVEINDGEPIARPDDSSRPSQILVSEFMILANSYAAKFCHDNAIPVPYRIQPPPAGNMPPFDIDSPSGVYKARRYMRKVIVSEEPSSHFSLGCEYYLQATSPLRRFLDLVVHRQIKSFLEVGSPCYSQEQIREIILRTESIRSGLDAAVRQRIKYWLLKYVYLHRTSIRKAVVLCKFSDKVVVMDEETLLESTIYTDTSALSEDQVIDVSVARVSPREEILEFQIA